MQGEMEVGQAGPVDIDHGLQLVPASVTSSIGNSPAYPSPVFGPDTLLWLPGVGKICPNLTKPCSHPAH